MPETDATTALKQHFGFDAFRPGQREAVEAVLAGQDVLAVMPTGSGKSLCYQLPALMRGDLTVVVSPLVSLMADQVGALGLRAPERAALINAQQESSENRETLRRALAGDLRLLYVAPERFAATGFLEALQGAEVGLFVVDEAHCVSEWGHDFRPDYFTLGDAARALGAGSIFAATATATPQVAADVVRRLGMRSPLRVSTGFDRPNLSFVVVPVRGAQDKHRRLVATLSEPGALPAIVYAGTRKNSAEIAARLTGELGEPALAYHAGLEREQRATVQRRFMEDDVRVIVATNAFGMGIDKAGVRTVAHASVPQSVEAYYQEAGRAGRDGAPARCLLFAEQRDKGLHVYFINQAEESAKQARWRQYRAVWRFVDGDGCRRVALLRHFGDASEPQPGVPCCDACDPGTIPKPVTAVRGAPAAGDGPLAPAGDPAALDDAILQTVAAASPTVGRTRVVEILRGGRGKVVLKYGYDELPAYGAYCHLAAAEVLERVDELIEGGALQRSTGRFPKLSRAA